MAIILWLVAFSRASTTCGDTTVYHEGQMVDLLNEKYVDASEMCTILGQIDTLDYCTHAICSDNGMVSGCQDYEAIPNITYNYVQETAGQLFSGNSFCIMNDDENCIRTFGDGQIKSNFSAANTQSTTPPECCMVECDGDNQITIQGCGSDGASYSDITTFCNAYCLNRTLTYTQCGSPGCGSSNGCPTTESFCIASFTGTPPVCGNNYTLYNTAAEYCADKIANQVTSFSSVYCDDTTGCTQENCYAQECIGDLVEAGYAESTICGTTGYLYNTLDDYCEALSNSIEFSYYLCSLSACLTTQDCCYQHCIENKTASFESGCGNDFTFYTTVAGFCTAQCSNSSLDFVKCNNVACTADQCSSLGCQDTNKFSVCETTSYTLITNVTYCDEEFDGDNFEYTIEGCVTGLTARSCTQDDCDYKSCLLTNTSANGETYNYCGNALNKFYTTTADYCNALEITAEITGEITCADGSCDSNIECCFNYCKDTTFNALNPYSAICQDTTFDLIGTVDDYCNLACTTGTYSALSEYKCSGNTCTSEQCCEKKCEAFNEDFNDVCSTTYDVVLSTDCATLCSETITFYTCTGDCSQTDCDYKECIASQASYKGTKVCTITGTNKTTFDLYDDDEDYCTDYVNDNNINTINCVDESCDSQAECCENYCNQNYGTFTSLCSTSYTQYTTLAGFCTADCTAPIDVLQCGTDNCDLTGCCKAECNSFAYTPVCDQGTYQILSKSEYCDFSCTDQTHFNSLDKCYDALGDQTECTTCLPFKCEDQVSSYPETAVCLKVTIYDQDYFETTDAYCAAMITGGSTEFSLTDEYLLCGSNDDADCETSADCCVAQCKAANPTYVQSCDTITYTAMSLEQKCVADCTPTTISLETCSGACTQKDCDVKDCVATIGNDSPYSTICLTEKFGGVAYFESLEAYCTALVEADASYTIDDPIGCPDDACNPEPECCENRCLQEPTYDSCATDFSLVTSESFCQYRCANSEVDMVVSGCESSNSPTDCVLRDCKLKDCLNTNQIATSICLADSTLGFIYADNITEHCNNLIDDDATSYTVSDNLACGSFCADNTACCNEVCAGKTYFNGCDPSTYQLIEETEYCSRTCDTEPNLVPLYCGVSTDCDQDDCDFKNCMNQLSAANTGSLCLESSFDEKYYFGSISDYCDSKVKLGNTTYTVGTEVTFVESQTEGDKNCCTARCATETYLDTCDPDLYTIVDETAYCNCHCDGNCKTLDSCFDDSNTPEACTSCEQFKCERTSPNHTFTNVCLVTALDTEFYFENVGEYCEAKILAGETDYALTSVITCTGGCTSDTLCCNERCKSESGVDIGCDPLTFDVVTLESYCSRTCGGESLDPLTCSGDCEDDDCAQKECESALSSTGDKICLTTAYANKNYYATLTEYCEAKVDAPDTTYTVENLNTCDGSCDSETECCKSLCNATDFKTSCDATAYTLVEKAAYCDDFCGDELLTLDHCYNALGVSKDCVSCYPFECEDNRYTELNSQTYPGYCGTDDIFYDTLLDYCEAEDADNSLNFAVCSDDNGFPAMCTTDPDCCLSNCQAITVYEGKCEDGDYYYVETVDEYCLAYCENDRTFTAFLDTDGNLADRVECCTQKCITTDQTKQASCDSTSYELVTVSTQCKNSCTNPPNSNSNLTSCVGGCTAEDCNILKCVNQDLASHTAVKVCGTDGILYASKEDYCTAKEDSTGTGPTLSYNTCSTDLCTDGGCSGSFCTTDLNCCAAKCVSDFDGNFTARCDSVNLTIYSTVETYCKAQCTSNFTDASCEGSTCSATQCCENKCNSQTYSTVCDALPSESTVDKSTYCTNNCADASYDSDVHKCTGDCTSDDCVYHKCFTDKTLSFPTGNICADTGSLYVTVDGYCTAYVAGTVSSVHTCTSGNCDTDTACCEDVCAENNNPYTERCDTSFNYYSTVGTYCTAYCSSSITDLSNCGDGSELCTEDECCQQRCKASSPYSEKCDTDYNLLSKDEFCDLYCPEETYTGVTCDGDCTQTICDKKNCMATLDSAKNDTICLRTDYNATFFYESLILYCDALVAGLESSYILPTEYSCSGSSCADDRACCITRCLEESYTDTCSKETDLVVDHQEYCEFRCDETNTDNTDKDVNTCTNADGTLKACTECAIFTCLKDIEGYSYTSICRTTAVDGLNYFETKTDYCEAMIEDEQTNYTIGDYELCSSAKCDDDISCCIELCNADDTIFEKCLTPAYTLLDKADYCYKTCNSESFTTTSCTGDCTSNLCAIQKCNLDNISYDYDTVCVVNDVSDYTFYESVDDFCTTRVNESESTTITDDIGCPTSDCVDDNDCCIYTCMENTYFYKCSATHVKLEQIDYCTAYCADNSVYVDTCKNLSNEEADCSDCELFICLDDLNPNPDQSICLRTTDYESTYHFDDYTAYCLKLIDQSSTYTLGETLLCGSAPCAEPEDCCKANCMEDTYPGYCDTSDNDFAYITQDSYCTSFCANTPPDKTGCESGCSETDCRKKDCEADYETYLGDYTTLCLDEAYDGDNFFSTVSEFCLKKANDSDTDYQVDDIVYCNDGTTNTDCNLSQDCCKVNCKATETRTRCNSTTYALVTSTTYCDNDCDEVAVDYDDCYDSFNALTSCTSCVYFSCEDTLASYTTEIVCADDYTEYTSKNNFCKAKDLNNALDFVLCDDDACEASTDCCDNVCLSKNDSIAYLPKCNNTTFVYDSTLLSYCTTFCSLDKNYTDYTSQDSSLASEEDCCTQKCILNNEAGNIVCNATTYALMTSPSICADNCNEIQNITCGSGNCTQTDCDIKKCALSDLASYNSTNICGSNGVFYTSKESFCTAKVNGASAGTTITKAACNDNSTCTTSSACCKIKCKADYVGTYSPVCDSSFTSYDDLDSYCTAQCTSAFTPAKCTGGANCTPTECCNGACNAGSYNSVCAPLPSTSLVTKSNYCTNKCGNTTFFRNVFSCGNANCTVTDCVKRKCEAATNTIFPGGNVCGLNGVLYPTVSNYCTAFANNVTTNYNLCPGGVACPNATACCEDVCTDNNPSYTARCDTSYNFYSTVASYCTAKCASSISDLSNCGSGSTLCTETECCNKECNANTSYSQKCDTSYNLITQSQFCNLYCPGETYSGISCDGDCTQPKCDKLNCMQALSPSNRPPICIGTPLTNLTTYYYATLSDYCDDKVIINDKTYTLPSSNTCYNGDCTSSYDCCVTRCLTETYFDSCDTDTYLTVNHLDFCNYRCSDSGNTDKVVNKCYEDDGTQKACENCKLFECIRDIASYTYSTVCLDTAYETRTFYASITSYCEAQVTKGETIYGVGTYTLCAGDTACADVSACCNAVCNKNNLNDGCDSTFTLYESTQYCTDYCNDDEDEFKICGTGCNQTACDILNCLDKSPGDSSNNVCVSVVVSGEYFFDSMDEYCEAKVDISTSYQLDNSIDCDGECSDEIDCCTYRCLENDNKIRCNSASYQLVSEYDYCNFECDSSKTTPTYDECRDGDDDLTDCVDCYAFECEDVAVTNGFTNLCLRTPINNEYHFTSQSDYCTFMLSNSSTSFTIGEIVHCPNDTTTECTSETDCCHERCMTRGDVVEGCSKVNYDYISVSQYCTMECNNTLPDFDDCEGSGCSETTCKEKACAEALKNYGYTAICLTTAYNSKNYFTNIDEYCNDKVSLSDTNYTISSSITCSSQNCASSNDCCNSRCLASTSNLSTCNASTYDVVTQSQKCTNSCSASPSLTTKQCTSGSTQVNCTTNLCNNMACTDSFTSNSYPYGNICLNEAYQNKNFYSTLSSYCAAKVTEGVAVTTLPAYTTCVNSSGGAKACTSILECCMARCTESVTTTGCTSTNLLKTPTEICTAVCSNNPFTMTYCGVKNCATCTNIDCYKQNNTYTDKGICLITAYNTKTYFIDVNEYCDAKLASNDTSYSVTGNTITCTDDSCNSSRECCDSTCLQSALTDRCDATTYNLVTKATHCSNSCGGNSLPNYLTCMNESTATNCTQTSCYVDFQCPAAFTNASYAYPSVCLSNQSELTPYFSTISAYCSANGTNGTVTAVPETVTCKNASGGNVNCATSDDCCYARCLEASYTPGCSSTFSLISQDDFCDSLCYDDAEISLTYCDGEACTDCKLLECLDTLKNNQASSVCLSSESATEFYFETKKLYCNYLIDLPSTDYALDAADYYCGDTGCADELACCQTRCDAQTYLSTCKNSDFSVFDQTLYCNNLCNETSVSTTPCLDGTTQIECDANECCAAKLTIDFNQVNVCGNDGTLYTSTLIFCVAKSTDISLLRVDCGSDCDTTTCDIKFCEANDTNSSESFPLCGNDNSLYTTKTLFCTALEADDTLETLSICNSSTCTEEICCGNACVDTLSGVLYYDTENDLKAFNNECLALCAGTIPANAYYCDVDQSIADCTTEYVTPCETQCASALNDTTTYCSADDGYLTAYSYCLAYTCSKGAKKDETFSAVTGCENNDCTNDSCSFNICLDNNDCRTSPINIICGSDGNSYINECAATCKSASVDSECEDPADSTNAAIEASLAACKPICADRVCSAICPDEGSQVCADDGTLYTNKCLAECYGNSFKFDCPTDCRGFVRDLRCKYECRKLAK